MKSLSGQRIIVCGKGGSGKSSLITLMAKAFDRRGYKVVLLDADASNPSGLSRLAFGNDNGPKPLIEFFGGRNRVNCPVDDPSPLTRKENSDPITESPIDLAELPSIYSIQIGNVTLLQTGKIKHANEGCDGPMAKVVRDFIVGGDYVTLIDTEAGIEHFGRGVEQNIDIVFIIVNPVFDAIRIAERVSLLCKTLGIPRVWAIINAVQSKKMENVMINELKQRNIKVLGTIKHDSEIQLAGLNGTSIGKCKAMQNMAEIIMEFEHQNLTETFV